MKFVDVFVNVKGFLVETNLNKRLELKMGKLRKSESNNMDIHAYFCKRINFDEIF